MMQPLLITVGEPAGVGPDCVIRAFAAEPELFNNCCIVAPLTWLIHRAKVIDIPINVVACNQPTASTSQNIQCWNPLPEQAEPEVHIGSPARATAQAVIACIKAAAEAALHNDASGLVTGPIEKAVLRDEGFNFPGHTEYLAALAGVKRIVMMLASDKLRIALLTTHVPLKDVSTQLSIKESAHMFQIIHDDLRQRFKIETPRLALCGLNPHAGESGHFGDEEQTVLTPAVNQAVKAGINIIGPLSADSLFSVNMRSQFDTIVCCYHDQGLIPIKALSFGEAVNVTLGLPFVRTSVDHGTATDRVGTTEVSHQSLLAAIRLAKRMVTGNDSAHAQFSR
ncbi:MAG: 4-hydroxythreonine-4-phosphate dehydrogenase PdxA [Mariprofundaceae bacterium]